MNKQLVILNGKFKRTNIGVERNMPPNSEIRFITKNEFKSSVLLSPDKFNKIFFSYINRLDYKKKLPYDYLMEHYQE